MCTCGCSSCCATGGRQRHPEVNASSHTSDIAETSKSKQNGRAVLILIAWLLEWCKYVQMLSWGCGPMCSGFCVFSARANTFNKIPKPRLWYLRCISRLSKVLSVSVALTSTQKLRGNACIRGQVAAGPWRGPQVPGAFAGGVNATYWWQISTQSFLGAGNECWQQVHRTSAALHCILEVFQGFLTCDASNVSMVTFPLSILKSHASRKSAQMSNWRVETKKIAIAPWRHLSAQK